MVQITALPCCGTHMSWHCLLLCVTSQNDRAGGNSGNAGMHDIFEGPYLLRM